MLLVCKWTTVAHGQTQEPAINIEFTDIPLSEAISRIEKSSKYTFFYDAKQTDLTLRVSLHAKQLPISAALRSDRHSTPNHLNGGITNDDHQSEGLLRLVHP